ncbi:unnamed protein product [Allacma fusca]|uniref:Protein hunchback n=1 Tax=Allacma fusca TaxID=39272 RepID=A0A8J2KAB6_9HEXA|nr:unnamed protein product [Allacma fusca]
MLVEQSSRVSPLTPVSSPPGSHLHHHLSHSSHLSPQTSQSSEASSSPRDDSSTSGSHSTPMKTLQSSGEHESPENFSALQRLQFALEKNSLFSSMYGKGHTMGKSGSLSPGADTASRCFPHDSDSKLMAKIPLGTPQSSDKSEGDPDENYRRTDMKINIDEHLVQTPTASPNGSIETPNVFQCPFPFCSIACDSKHQFNEHLVSHSQQHACPKCNFLTSSKDTLRSHLQDSHDINEQEVITDDEARVPKINSQGKIKTFKCKQCDYKAVTKKDFWDHSREHIRPEKILSCPYCDFVTEYKHHYEYHVRNHSGNKPYQCSKCPYSCVNKSMLNSHLKSHSNVYQYRCRDCAYATKYCHSLKLHLRKYSHSPSVVLNLDGTPNPLPIIDVYGTRRGPKIKRSDNTPPTSDYNSNIKATNTNLVKNELKKRCNNNINNKAEEDKPKVRNQDYNTTPPSKKYTTTSGSEHSDTEQDSMYLRQLQLQQMRHSMPETPVTPTSVGFHGLMQNHLGSNGHEQQMQVAATAAAAAAAVAGKNPLELYAAAINQYILASNPLLQMVPPLSDLAKLAKEQQNQILSQMMYQSPMMPQSQCASPPPLLASKTSYRVHPQPPMGPTSNVNQNQGHTPLDLRNPKSSPNTYEPHRSMELSEKRKRKGKAVRYDRAAISNMKVDHDVEEEALDFSNNNVNIGRSGRKSPKLEISREDSPGQMLCKYCEIAFPDKVLYSMHMSYHFGDGDPFQCKSCGKKTNDKISFFRHLTTDSH